MNSILLRLLSSLSRATLDPSLGGKGMALSRVFSLASFGIAAGDEDAMKHLEAIAAKLEKALSEARHLTHEEWNDLQGSAEAGHWFLRAQFPQVTASGQVAGGYTHPVTQAEPEDTDSLADTLPAEKDIPLPAPNHA